MNAPPANRRRWLWLVGFLLAPAGAHWLATMATAPNAPPRFLDTVVSSTLLAYLAVVAGAAAMGQRVMGRMLLLVYSTLFALVLLECALAVLSPPPPAGLPMAPGVRRTVAADTMPGVSGEIVFSVNRRGLRAPEHDPRSFLLRILCVGGSTTQCVYVTDELSWPWVVQTRLDSQVPGGVFVGNAGKSGEIALNHAYLIRNYEPADQFQWALVLCGINDLGALLRGNYEARRSAVASDTLTQRLERSIYYRRLAIVRLASQWGRAWLTPDVVIQDAGGRWYEAQRALRQQRLRESPLQQAPGALPQALERYRADVLDIIAACRERGLRPLLMTQPTMYRADLPEPLRRLLWSSCDEGAYPVEVLADMMGRFNQVTREVCADQQTPLVDLATLLPKDDTVFYDDCHFNIEGCRQVAALVSAFFEKELRDQASEETTP